MSNSQFWLKKINALLHDPPDKPLDISGHEGKAANWARSLGITLSNQDFKEADWIASACDRLNFPDSRNVWADFIKMPCLSHPLAGESLSDSDDMAFLLEAIDSDGDYTAAMKKSLELISPEIKSQPKKLFLWLWRNWSAQIQETQGNQLGVLWDMLPADTRIPDHSIWVHQALTSAIAATDSKPAFLLFTVGPVQAFISAARRTQDLWAGSYLLSYLNWAAIEVIAEEIGPDAVIFPSLLGQPLCDHWLHSQKILSQKPHSQSLILPSLPNRFLAIVPAERGVELAKKADERMRAQWCEITTKVCEGLKTHLGFSPNWSKTWKRQTENLFETYWQVYPWLPKGDKIQDKNYKFITPHKPYLDPYVDRDKKITIEDILKLYTAYSQKTKYQGRTYYPNIGAIYCKLYEITEKLLGSRKGLRNFDQVEETGEKSTLGGDRAALHNRVDDIQQNQAAEFDNIPRREIREFWDKLSKNLGQNQIQSGGKERIDAVELTKRCAWQFYFSKQSDFPEELRFPSTNTVATASFKKDVIEKLKSETNQPLKEALEAWLNTTYPTTLSQGNTSSKDVIPYLSKLVSSSDELLNKFLRLDGRLLYEETYGKEDEFNEGVTLSQRKKGQKALNKFLEMAVKHGISKPRKYFAVLMMDGDEMGKWLSGDKMPVCKKVLHPNTLQALE
ncbi:MAG: type III-B CRISPR-associated protein Cas10/Cmr2, partial [Nostoc sp. C3-bin3]|nr:type III-B CRISPR-associated protein Cas10/Cmr2 [Nostoc sp. C3-bin3]